MSERKLHPRYLPLRVRIRPTGETATFNREAITGSLVNVPPEITRTEVSNQEQVSEKERRGQQIKELLRLCGLLRADLSLDEVLQQIVHATASCTGFRALCLGLLDQSGKTGSNVAMTGINEEDERILRETHYPVDMMLSLMRPEFRISESYFVPYDRIQMLDSDIPLVYAKDAKDVSVEIYQSGQWHPEDLLIIPLYSSRAQRLLGFLSVDDPEDGKRPTEEVIELVELFADKAATAIDNAQFYEEREMERLSLEKGIAILREDLELMAQGDWSVGVRSTHAKLEPVVESINVMIERLKVMLLEMQRLTQVVDDHMQMVHQNSDTLDQDAHQQDIQITQIAHTVNDFAVMMDTISERAANLSKTALDAAEVTSDAQEKFDRAIDTMYMVREATLQSARTMKALGESGQEINETTVTLNELTTRMHLLALNAAIETARAGEQGKSFAVIAQEIRTLAMHSSEATRQVTSYIHRIQQEATRVSQSVEQNTQKVVMQTELVMQTGVALDTITIVMEQLTKLVEDICASAVTQSQGSAAVMIAVGEIKRMTGDVTSHMHEMQQSTMHLMDLSNSLRSQLARIRTGDL
jgi:methyl-accepting chemotaxis protein